MFFKNFMRGMCMTKNCVMSTRKITLKSNMLRAMIAGAAMFCANASHAQYCTPTYTNGCSFGDQIVSLVLNGESGTSINDAGGNCVSGGSYYVNQSGNMSVTLSAGNTYSMSLHTNALGYDNAKAWIDFNHNNVFDDPSELVATSTQISNTTSYLPIAIPSTAVQGTYRMRIRLNQDPAPASLTPCASTNLGEARDYALVLSLQPLPVTLISFSGKISGPADLLYWTVGDTRDLASFTLERSVDGVAFAPLGTVDKKAGLAHANETDYSFNDEHPLSGDNYYRLGVKEVSGKMSYSNTVLLHRENAADQMLVYPNPAKSQFHLKFTSAANETLTISIMDVNGRVVKTEQRAATRGNNDFTFNCNNLAAGSYMVHAVTTASDQYLTLLVQ